MPERYRIVPALVLLATLAAASAAAPQTSRAEEPRDGGKTAATAGPLRFGPVKLGVDVMTRAETIGNFGREDFSFTPGDDDSRIVFRVRPSLAVSPSKFFRVRIEGQWHAFYDDADSSTATLYQGYVEGSLPSSGRIAVRAGRQELSHGSTFILGADTFFNGLTFDAVKVTLKPFDDLSVDLFGGRYAKQVADGIEGTLYGAYGTYAAAEALTLDLFGLRDTGDDGLVHVGGDHEVTYSVGTRIVAGLPGGSVSLEIEPVYQFGRKNVDGAPHNDISAYGGHADLTVDPPLGRYPGKLFFSYAFGSGDGSPDEGTFTEFHNPNNDTSLVGDMSVIGDLSGLTVADPAGNDVSASGLHVLTVGGGVDVTEKLNVSVDGHYFRAVKVPAGIGKEIGIETNLIVTYKIRESISVLLSGNRFFTGEFFKDAAGSGKDINYVYAQLQATF